MGTDATAPFAYYKNFLNPGASQPIVPPVSADALTIYHWMESYCLSTNVGIELDYMGFFYYLQTKTANAYSFANMNTLFSQECGGTCNSADVVSWTTLQSAANSSFGAGSAKANHLNTTADSFGVNH